MDDRPLPADDDTEHQTDQDATDTTDGRLPDGNYVGEDNIRQGRVGGVMGGPHQQGGEGQGG